MVAVVRGARLKETLGCVPQCGVDVGGGEVREQLQLLEADWQRRTGVVQPCVAGANEGVAVVDVVVGDSGEEVGIVVVAVLVVALVVFVV